jgi:hypothetical protein
MVTNGFQPTVEVKTVSLQIGWVPVHQESLPSNQKIDERLTSDVIKTRVKEGNSIPKRNRIIRSPHSPLTHLQ